MSDEPVPLSYSANALLGVLEDKVQGEASASDWLEALALHDRGLVASAVADGDVDAVVGVAAREGYGSGRMVTAEMVADRASDHAAAQGGVAKTSDVAAALVDMVREDRASGENATEAPPVVPEKGAAQPEEVREARAGATAERVVRVFVSSTFRDMGAERDELVKRVFPQIRKLCDERGVTWGEVDLRWGITDEQVAEGKVLPICLAEIDRSRPYFIGLLGERYGSMPDKIDAELIEREPWLGEHLGHSVTEVEIQHGVLRNPAMAEHAYFYLRDPAYVETLPEGERGGYREASAEFAAMRDALKERIRRSGVPIREAYADPRALGQLVLEDFTALIERLFPEGSLPDPLDREAAEHEAFARSGAGVYVGRRTYFDRLRANADGDGAPLAVLGESGSGKSALLANWAIERRASHPDDVVLMHFIGGTPRSSDWATMLRRIMGELARRFGINLEIPDQPDALRLAFANLLHMAAARGRVILVLDALDQLEDREGALDLAWLPPEVPSGVRLIVSTLPGRPLAALHERGWQTLEVEPLESDERRELIEAYLAQFARRLSAERVGRIASAPQAANPLYLRALLEELRVFGVHERLDERINHYLAADTVVDLYKLILQRYEEDYERERPGLVRDAMSLLWAARRGLSEAELLDLLGTEGSPLPRAYWSPLFLAAEQMLVRRSGLLGFFHDYLQQAVQHRYLPTEAQQEAAHLTLAAYFGENPDSRRAVDELPWQLSRARAWAKLWALLGDPEFLVRAWAVSEWDVKALWVELGANVPDLGMLGAYQPVIERPQNFDLGAQRAAMLLLAHAGHRDQALAIGRSLVKHSRRDGNRRLLAEMLGEVGQLLVDPAKRAEAFSEQEEIARSLGDRVQEAYALILQVGLLIEGERLDDAEGLLDRHADLARRSGSRAQLHLGLGNRAVIHAKRGDFDSAEQLLLDKERIAREIGDLAGVASALHNRAVARADRGDPAGAIELFEESARINRSLGDRGTLLVSVLARGQQLLLVMRVPEAKTVLREALALADELGADAWAERARQLLDQAEKYVDISESVNERARQWVQEHRSTEPPRPEKVAGLRATRDELTSALERDPRNAAMLTQLGAVLIELDEPQEAEGALRAALDLDDAFGSIERVDARVREVARRSGSLYLPTATRRAMCYMAFACERLGRSKVAEDYILDAVFDCKDPVLLVMAGRFYLESTEPEVDTAIAYFKKAIASSPAAMKECDELLDTFVATHKVLYPRSSWEIIERYLAIWESLKQERR
jgi:tetratricopeptide (TPR) repeat protein